MSCGYGSRATSLRSVPGTTAELPPRRPQIIAEALGLVSLLAHEAEQREEIVRAHVPGCACDLALVRHLLGKARCGLREKLERRRESYSIFRRQRLLGHLRAVEIRHLARPDDIELQDPGIGFDLLLDTRP